MCDDKKANGSLKRKKSKLQRQKCKKKILRTLGMKIIFTRR